MHRLEMGLAGEKRIYSNMPRSTRIIRWAGCKKKGCAHFWLQAKNWHRPFEGKVWDWQQSLEKMFPKGQNSYRQTEPEARCFWKGMSGTEKKSCWPTGSLTLNRLPATRTFHFTCLSAGKKIWDSAAPEETRINKMKNDFQWSQWKCFWNQIQF